MRPFRQLIHRQEALKIIQKNIQKIEETEKIALEEAVNRVLAEKVVANFNVPPFDRSSMDGYAVKAHNTFNAGQFKAAKLKMIGVEHAGEVYKGTINEGECIQIATGSPIPEGADAVVMVEYTDVSNEIVSIKRPVYPGANIGRAGEDIKKGETVLKQGELLTPAKIGAIAALGNAEIKVYCKPRVAIFSTGSEIVTPGRLLEPGEIYDINSYTLQSIVFSNGCLPINKGIIKDNKESIINALKESQKYDLVVFSGGSSVGEKDLLSVVLNEKGNILFHGVQIKPGKPTLFGTITGVPLFGMPGYPTSCLSNAYQFLIPALRKISGQPKFKPEQIQVRMGHRIVSASGREQFLTVQIKDEKAYVVYKQSGDITSMANAEGYIILPINQDTLEEGEMITVFFLE
jgi:molybdenum cofactor synthesis domain-containing protein